MSLNKLLCKYLDKGDEWSKEGKGYVTLGDLITTSAKLVVRGALIAMYIQGAIFVMEDYIDGVLIGENCTGPEALCIAVFLVVDAIVICAVATTILQCIIDVWDIKIAKCDRKEGDE